jgi:hypothetical protein
MLRRLLACSLTLGFAASEAICAEWRPFPSSQYLVAAGFEHSDGGALVVMCDTRNNLISINLVEPRAQWARVACDSRGCACLVNLKLKHVNRAVRD